MFIIDFDLIETMCSIGEDDFGDEGGLHTMQKDITQSLDTLDQELICKKCNINKVSIKLNFREAECKECFLAYARHKFRAALGSSKVLPKGSTVLILFDGSAESIVLLDMLHYAKSQNNFKRLHCLTKVVYIDESLLENPSSSNTDIVQKFLENYDFESFLVSITDARNVIPFTNIDAYQKPINSDFIVKVNQIKTLTSRQDFIQKHRNNLIGSVASQLSCNFIFLPDISTSLAATLLTNISLGRGASTALDVSLMDNRLDNLKIVRPLKDLNELEISSYLKIQFLRPLKQSFYGESNGISASIQNLTKNFVNNLQKDYPSTVSTVFRTGDKIASKPTDESLQNSKLGKHTCKLCKSSLDYFNSNTLMAIEFSRLVSENASRSLENTESLEDISKLRLYATNEDSDSLRLLCHGCRNIYNDCLDENLF